MIPYPHLTLSLLLLARLSDYSFVQDGGGPRDGPSTLNSDFCITRTEKDHITSALEKKQSHSPNISMYLIYRFSMMSYAIHLQVLS